MEDIVAAVTVFARRDVTVAQRDAMVKAAFARMACCAAAGFAARMETAATPENPSAV